MTAWPFERRNSREDRCSAWSVHRRRKGLLRALKDKRMHLHDRDSCEVVAYGFAMGRPKPARMNANPGLVMKQPAGDQWLRPEPRWGCAVLGQQVGEDDRRVDVDQRSCRSRSSSFKTSFKGATGIRGGGPSATIRGALR